MIEAIDPKYITEHGRKQIFCLRNNWWCVEITRNSLLLFLPAKIVGIRSGVAVRLQNPIRGDKWASEKDGIPLLPAAFCWSYVGNIAESWKWRQCRQFIVKTLMRFLQRRFFSHLCSKTSCHACLLTAIPSTPTFAASFACRKKSLNLANS